MNHIIRTHIRTLAAAALLAATVAGVSAEQAHAKPKRPTDNGVRCALPGSATGDPEDIVFYLPGDSVIVTDSEGRRHLLVCREDGRWDHRASFIRPGLGGASPQSGGGVLSPR